MTELLETPNRLLVLKKRVDLLNDHIWDLHSKKVRLEKDLEVKKKGLLV